MTTDHKTTDQNDRHAVPGRLYRRAGLWLFIGLQLLTASMACFVVFARSLPTRPTLPLLRNDPLRIPPLYNDPRVITDDQLSLVLTKLRPRIRQTQPKINSVDHGLRFWGVESVFSDPMCYSGQEMRQLLLHHPTYAEAWGEGAEPFLISTSQGVAVRTRRGQGSASHVDHTLATLAEVGTPLDFPVSTVSGEFRVRDILENALREFSLNQPEYEWTTLSLALYAPSNEPWVSSEGQRISFDLLADRIMRQSLSQGVCYGQHRLYSLVMMVRIQDEIPLLSQDAYDRVVEHLMDATRKLIAHQSAEGWWDTNWPHGKQVEKESRYGDLSRRMLATGHAVEWWAMAPKELHPPREVVIRASQWLVKEVEGMEDGDVIARYPFLTHVGRGLALWRGKTHSDLTQ